jgi:CRISPR-associated protein Csy3
MKAANTAGTSRKTNRTAASLPAVLSFRRAFEITDCVLGAMQGLGPESKVASIQIYDHGKRTTASYEGRKETGEANRKGDDSRNLVFGEEAKLPAGYDVLTARFSMRVMPIHVEPDSCDDTEWFGRLKSSIELARTSDATRLLARYYAYNIANASWLWRNRDVADSVRVEVRFGHRSLDHLMVIDDALDLHLRPVLARTQSGTDPHESCREIDTFAQAIHEVLSGQAASLRITVTAYAAMLPGQSVWPSQLYTPVKQKVTDKISKGRQFFQVGGSDGDDVESNPAITAEKVGNALRTFDRDHGSERFADAIIPIEPNGGALRLGVNLRGPGNRFYDHLKNFAAPQADSEPHGMLTDDQMLYVLGCIVRGGVYGSSSKEEAAA